MKYGFIQEHRKCRGDRSGTVGRCPGPRSDRWPVSVICSVLKVVRSGFYAWCRRKPSRRQIRQQKLLVKIRQVYEEHQGRYGSPRVCRALLIDGELLCRNTVAKLMRQAKIRAKTRRRFVPRTTDSTHQKPVADNLLDRDLRRRRRIRSGWRTSPMSTPLKDGCSAPGCWTASAAKSSAGRCPIRCPPIWSAMP